MYRVEPENLDLILVEDKIWVLVAEVGLSIYDFSLTEFLPVVIRGIAPNKLRRSGDLEQ
jgi:hypothetical protein